VTFAPRHVMVKSGDVVKLIDFGLACSPTDRFRSQATARASNYLAPRIIRALNRSPR